MLLKVKTCKEIKEKYPSSPSGVYAIKPQDSQQAFEVYCGMDKAGTTCSNIRLNYTSAPSGMYTIQPKPSEPAFEIYCGMDKTGTTCNNIQQNYPLALSGVYTIRPQLSDVEVYCDMTTAQGGWTLVYSYGFNNYVNFK